MPVRRFLSCLHFLDIFFHIFSRSTMSWDSYIDNLIGHAKDTSGTSIDKACIIGSDGAPWTSDAHANAFRLSDQERKKIATEMGKGISADFGACGIMAGGIKYQFLRYTPDDQVALGKKKGEGAITMQASKTAIVIAHTAEGAQQGTSNKAVGVIADYLTSLGM